jgi:hypothetical protein
VKIIGMERNIIFHFQHTFYKSKTSTNISASTLTSLHTHIINVESPVATTSSVYTDLSVAVCPPLFVLKKVVQQFVPTYDALLRGTSKDTDSTESRRTLKGKDI